MPALPFRAEPPAAEAEGVFHLTLETSQGDIRTVLRLSPGEAAVLWVFGAGGGLGGPAGGIYTRLGEQLRTHGVSSLELDYRRPARLEPCVDDVLTGIELLKGLGRPRIVLVGHSFGGAVVISAGAQSDDVIAVAALSSQTAGTSQVGQLSPRPVLFAHGEADEVLPDSCSRDLFHRAGEPKTLRIYSGCRHGLDQCRDALDEDLRDWLLKVIVGG